ncbi:MAG: TonB-dependent receptor [Capnocytophaga sp.]|nr:TonB-dependent receptor [Capnocytophaga sp.]
MSYRCLLFWFCLLFVSFLYSQQVDLETLDDRIKETIKKNPFSISGSASANGVYTQASDSQMNAPFLYFLSGNINIGVYDWSIPFSYRFTNQGDNFNYQIPFKFNRLSLHPKYKWIQAHIGDATMTFSPYTFNGLQFTGGGLELTPDKFPIKASFMAGRLLKAVEYDGQPQSTPNYQRWGYGTKLEYKHDNIELGAIVFAAKDDPTSLTVPIPDEKNIYPLQNQVYSLLGKYKPLHFVEVFGEYALSALGYVDEVQKKYVAYNTGINFIIGTGSIGVRYEFVAPEYRTLGAYYFVNDMENIVLNSSVNLFRGNVTLSSSIGRQKDNLNGQKIKQSNQWVGSANVSAKITNALLITGSYSNFTMFTNKHSSPFERINNPLLYEQPQDSINYKQVSQNTAINIAYSISETQQFALTYTLNDVVNRENEIVRRGGISRFHNAGVNYSILFPERKMSITPSFNYTYNLVAREKSHIFGPSVQLAKTYLEDKLTTSLGGNYSRLINAISNANTINIQLSAVYSPWKNHQFNLSAIQSFRNNSSQTAATSGQNTHISIGYVYNFDKVQVPLPKIQFKKKENLKPEKHKNAHKDSIDKKKKEITNIDISKKQKEKISTTKKRTKKTKDKAEVAATPIVTEKKPNNKKPTDSEVANLLPDLSYIPDLYTEVTTLSSLIDDPNRTKSQQRQDKQLLEKKIEQAQSLQRDYRFFVFQCLQNLYNQATKTDGRLKSNLLAKKQIWDKEKTQQAEEQFRKAEEGFTSHLWMMQQLEGLTLQDVINEEGLLMIFAERHKKDIFEVLQKNIATKEKMNYISVLLADFYHTYNE